MSTFVDGGHPAAASVLDQQVAGEVALEQRRRGTVHGLDQRPLDLGSGRRAARVDDTRPRVTALPRQLQLA
jgi:hypothetical protein